MLHLRWHISSKLSDTAAKVHGGNNPPHWPVVKGEC